MCERETSRGDEIFGARFASKSRNNRERIFFVLLCCWLLRRRACALHPVFSFVFLYFQFSKIRFERKLEFRTKNLYSFFSSKLRIDDEEFVLFALVVMNKAGGPERRKSRRHGSRAQVTLSADRASTWTRSSPFGCT